MTVSRKAIGLDAYPYINFVPPCSSHSICVHSTLPVFLSRHCSRPVDAGGEYAVAYHERRRVGTVPHLRKSLRKWHRSRVLPDGLPRSGIDRGHSLLPRPPVHRIEDAGFDGRRRISFAQRPLPHHLRPCGRPDRFQPARFGREVSMRTAPLCPGHAVGLRGYGCSAEARKVLRVILHWTKRRTKMFPAITRPASSGLGYY